MNTFELAKRIRTSALKMVHKANASHIGSCLSVADILAVLYEQVLNYNPSKPDWPDRDRFFLSKGHAAAILYAVLAEKGFFPMDWLKEYCCDESPLIGHVSHKVPGVELSTGSLGHALSVACGVAKFAKIKTKKWKTYAILSDGELEEGSNWEAFLFAAQHNLRNLTVIIDNNNLQGFGKTKDIIGLEPLEDKLIAFGWNVNRVSGHNYNQLLQAMLNRPAENEKPYVIIADTVKGKGVSFMENKLEWHYKSPSDEQLKNAIVQIEKAGESL